MTSGGISELIKLIEEKTIEGRDVKAFLIGTAYEGHPTQEKALVFAFGGKEYLVPFQNVWDGARVIETSLHLDRVERVIARPYATSRISEMLRSRVVSKEAQAAILNGLRDWFLPEENHRLTITPFRSGQAS